MNRQSLPLELIYQVSSLLIAFIVVHGTYVGLVRPKAEAFLQQETIAMNQNSDHVQKRDFYVVIKDYEQEACFILMFWAFSILIYKGINASRQKKMTRQNILQIPATLPIGTDDIQPLLSKISSLPEGVKDYLLPRALRTGILRFGATLNIQDSATAVRNCCESEMERLESELSIIRYIAWAIPSVGFIGTVRGIGAALSLAHQAVEGDITGVTQSLGVAFNSTFIALIISIILMFFIHQLQLVQERLVLDTESYCDDQLISRLRINPMS